MEAFVLCAGSVVFIGLVLGFILLMRFHIRIKETLGSGRERTGQTGAQWWQWQGGAGLGNHHHRAWAGDYAGLMAAWPVAGGGPAVWFWALDVGWFAANFLWPGAYPDLCVDAPGEKR